VKDRRGFSGGFDDDPRAVSNGDGPFVRKVSRFFKIEMLVSAAYERLLSCLEAPYSICMEVHVAPELAKKLNDLATTTGRTPDELVHDALNGYLEELTSLRETLDSRYDDLKSGRVKPIDGESFFESLRRREDDPPKRPPQ
jgi:predicted DNA-binding protein